MKVSRETVVGQTSWREVAAKEATFASLRTTTSRPTPKLLKPDCIISLWLARYLGSSRESCSLLWLFEGRLKMHRSTYKVLQDLDMFESWELQLLKLICITVYLIVKSISNKLL